VVILLWLGMAPPGENPGEIEGILSFCPFTGKNEENAGIKSESVT